MHVFEVAVLGAGPAGLAASLQLSRQGCAHALIDACVFPRDKVCGDAFSGKAVYVLRSLLGNDVDDLLIEKAIHPVRYMRLISAQGDALQLQFHPGDATPLNGFVAARADFDELLLRRAVRSPYVTWMPGLRIRSARWEVNSWALLSANGEIIRARCLIVANGARSFWMRRQRKSMRSTEEVIAVRAYYQGVKSLDVHTIELHFLADIAPGYLWLFPMANGRANVGLGIKAGQLNEPIRKRLFRYLRMPPFAERMKNAELLSSPRGWPIPIFEGRWDIVGDAFMLVGDAASLVDPFTGEGIGNALISGKRAAEVVGKAKNYTASALYQYVRQLQTDLKQELALGIFLQRLASHPRVFSWLLRRFSMSAYARRKVSEMVLDVSARNVLKNPFFYLRLLLG